MNFQIVLILGVAGCYFIGLLMESMATSGFAQWPPEERQRISERLARWEGLLRFLDIAGIAILVMGLLRFFGALRFLPLTASRILVLAIVVLCLERVVRGWTTWHCLRDTERPEVRVRGLMAALFGMILQVALASWVAWWVFTNVKVIKRGGGRTAGGGTPAGQTTGPTGTQTGGGGEVTTPPEVSPWVSEAEILQLLGKDKEYLDLLIPQMQGMFGTPVRMVKDGRTLYHREHFKKYKAGGLPMIEDLRRLQGGQRTPKPPEPLDEGELLQE
jgi:hypothetical protein